MGTTAEFLPWSDLHFEKGIWNSRMENSCRSPAPGRQASPDWTTFSGRHALTVRSVPMWTKRSPRDLASQFTSKGDPSCIWKFQGGKSTQGKTWPRKEGKEGSKSYHLPVSWHSRTTQTLPPHAASSDRWSCQWHWGHRELFIVTPS